MTSLPATARDRKILAWILVAFLFYAMLVLLACGVCGHLATERVAEILN